MENFNHPILQQAIEKQNKAIADAEYWGKFINDYKTLANISGQTSLPLEIKVTRSVNSLHQGLSWAEIRRLVKETLEKKSTIENAAAFVYEFRQLGYRTTKESVSACL